MNTDANKEDKPMKKGKYIPIKEWDMQNKDGMSKKEQLQWECQRGSDLRHNLKLF